MAWSPSDTQGGPWSMKLTEHMTTSSCHRVLWILKRWPWRVGARSSGTIGRNCFFLYEDPLFGCWFSAVSSKRSTVQVEEERHVALLLDVRVTEESQNLSEWFSSAIRKTCSLFLRCLSFAVFSLRTHLQSNIAPLKMLWRWFSWSGHGGCLTGYPWELIWAVSGKGFSHGRFDWFQVSWGKKPRDPRTTIKTYCQNLW